MLALVWNVEALNFPCIVFPSGWLQLYHRVGEPSLREKTESVKSKRLDGRVSSMGETLLRGNHWNSSSLALARESRCREVHSSRERQRETERETQASCPMSVTILYMLSTPQLSLWWNFPMTELTRVINDFQNQNQMSFMSVSLHVLYLWEFKDAVHLLNALLTQWDLGFTQNPMVTFP